jgi:hypothetical protein
MGKRESNFIIILDVDKIFSTDELALVQETREEAKVENALGQ